MAGTHEQTRANVGRIVPSPLERVRSALVLLLLTIAGGVIAAALVAGTLALIVLVVSHAFS